MSSPANPAIAVIFSEERDERETRWLRVEQVGRDDESATLEQAANLIDALYGVNLCDDQGNEAGDMGAGGNAAPSVDDLPDRNAYLDLAKSQLASLCDESGYWTAEVDVMRSHRESGYSLESDSCRIGETVIMRREVVEDVEMSAASYDLEWPYDGELRVSGAAGDADVVEVRGSTVYFQERVGGRVRFRYRTLYDRVTVHVPTRRAQNDAQRAEPAAVVAFWENLAASCNLIQPAADNGVDARERERLCDPEHRYRREGECWEEHERYDTCLCSGRETGIPVVDVVDAPCPEGTAPGAYLGKIRTRGETAHCEGEGDELSDPDYYLEKCCVVKEVEKLPACEETREPYRGGAEIENGPEYWIKRYGSGTRLIAVAPESEDGLCGELVRHWRVDAQDCGDCRGARPPSIPYETVVAPNTEFQISASGGVPPLRWSSVADISGLSNNTRTAFFSGVMEQSHYLVTVTDACGRITDGYITTPNALRPENEGSCLKDKIPKLVFGSRGILYNVIVIPSGSERRWENYEYPITLLEPVVSCSDDDIYHTEFFWVCSSVQGALYIANSSDSFSQYPELGADASCEKYIGMEQALDAHVAINYYIEHGVYISPKRYCGSVMKYKHYENGRTWYFSTGLIPLAYMKRMCRPFNPDVDEKLGPSCKRLFELIHVG